MTPDGESITGFVENMDGSGTDIDAVNGYLRSMVDDWTRSRRYNGMVLCSTDITTWHQYDAPGALSCTQ